MNNYLKYIMTVNGTKGKGSLRDTFIEEMADSYNEAKNNLITKFRVLINSNEALNVIIDSKKTKCLVKSIAKESNTTGTYPVRVRTEIGDLTEGSMVEITNKERFLVMSKIENINDYSQGYGTYCNQEIKLSKNKKIYCVMDNTTYGVKGLKDNGTFKELDAKMKCFVQANNLALNFYEGMRVLVVNKSDHFDGEIPLDKKWVCYEVIKIDHAVMEGLYVMEMQMTPLTPLDDLINGIAHNEGFNVGDLEYKIEGLDVIYVGKKYAYEIIPSNKDVVFEVDDNCVDIISQGSGNCEIIGLSQGMATLKAKINDSIVAEFNIMVFLR